MVHLERRKHNVNDYNNLLIVSQIIFHVSSTLLLKVASNLGRCYGRFVDLTQLTSGKLTVILLAYLEVLDKKEQIKFAILVRSKSLCLQ